MIFLNTLFYAVSRLVANFILRESIANAKIHKAQFICNRPKDAYKLIW